MYRHILAATALTLFPRTHAWPADQVTKVKCETERPTQSLNTITFTVVAFVDPSISHWDQFLVEACPTPPPVDPFNGSGKVDEGHHDEPWLDHSGHETSPKHEGSDGGWYEVKYIEREGEPPHHWYYDHHSRHPYRTGSLAPWPEPTGNSLSPGPSSVSTWHPRPWPHSSSDSPPRPIQSSTDQPNPPYSTTSEFSLNPVQSSTDQPEPNSSGSSNPPGPLPSSTGQPDPLPSSSPGSSLEPLPSSTDQPRPEPSSSDSTPSSSTPPDPGPSSSAEPSSPSTTLATSTTSSASPTQTCEDISNGSFENGNIGAWFISDQVTADSRVVQEGPDGVDYSFALIPSQQQFAQVYLNQYIPRCGDPPPIVDIQVSFSYEFTGASEGCSIAASVNRSPENLFTIVDDGQSPGVWQRYQGPVISVQLTYDPLFILKLVCQEDTANEEAILVTDISVYG